MAVRDGMLDLIERVRALSGATVDEFTVGDDYYWKDEHIQNLLDANSTFMVDASLTWLPQSIGGGTVEYHTCAADYRDFEEADSGTARWIIRDGPGAEQGTAGYTVNYRTGRITFTADQGGTAYYLTAYSYDVHAAAADLVLERLAHFQDYYDFEADGGNYSRSQVWEHNTTLEKTLRAKAGANLSSNVMGEVRMAQFVRSDLNG